MNHTKKDCVDLFEVCGRMHPVTGYAKDKALRNIPVVSIPMMTDYSWQKSCLESRLRNPELYADTEDVEATIAELREWLGAHAPEEKEAAV